MDAQNGETEISSSPAIRAYCFAEFRIDLPFRTLLRDGEVVPLTPKILDTLVALIRNRDRLVAKEELMKSVWHDSCVSDDSLTQSISMLRRALGDDAAHPKFIATLARRGYRFIGDVTEVPDACYALSASFEASGGTEVEPAQESAPEGPTLVLTPAATIAVRRWAVWPAALLVAGFLLFLILFSRGLVSKPGPPSDAVPLRFTQGAPEDMTLISAALLSPDGRYIAFVARHENSGRISLCVRTLETGAVHVLPGTDDASNPFWAPDSRLIAFFVSGTLKRVGLGADPPQTITSAYLGGGGLGGSWGTNGLIIFSSNGTGLFSVAPDGGVVRKVTSLDSSQQDVGHRWPQFLPDGRHFVFVIDSLKAERAGTYAGSIDSLGLARVLDVPGTYAPPGYIIFNREGILMAQPFDPVKRHLTGKPFTLTGDAGRPLVTSGPVASATSNLLVFPGTSTTEDLEWFNRSGERLSSVKAPVILRNPALAPDGKQVFAADAKHTGLWLIDLDRSAVTRIASVGMRPVGSPDGHRIAFTSFQPTGMADIYLLSTSTRSQHEELLLHTDENKMICDWSPDGRYIVYASINPQTKTDLWLLPQFGDRKPVSFLRTGANELQGQISPDGRWIAYTSDESGSWEVYVRSFPEGGSKQVVSIGGGVEPRWRGDGGEIYYLQPNRMLMVVEVQVGSVLSVRRPKELFRTPVASLSVYANHYAVDKSGERFLVDSIETGKRDEPITLLVNWASLAKK